MCEVALTGTYGGSLAPGFSCRMAVYFEAGVFSPSLSGTVLEIYLSTADVCIQSYERPMLPFSLLVSLLDKKIVYNYIYFFCFD